MYNMLVYGCYETGVVIVIQLTLHKANNDAALHKKKNMFAHPLRKSKEING